jgi:hypothetical protein
MTKTTTKAKAGTKPSTPAAPLIVLGYDENHKPRAARFPATDAELVAKAAQLMDLKVYQAATEDLAALPRRCRRAGSTATAAASCLTSGKACTARSSWSSRANQKPPSAKTKTSCRSRSAYPGPGTRSPGHLVIAQEALDYGWWEAIVIGRSGDMFTLRFRDYPKLPKFVRHQSAIALISPPAE